MTAGENAGPRGEAANVPRPRPLKVGLILPDTEREMGGISPTEQGLSSPIKEFFNGLARCPTLVRLSIAAAMTGGCGRDDLLQPAGTHVMVMAKLLSTWVSAPGRSHACHK